MTTLPSASPWSQRHITVGVGLFVLGLLCWADPAVFLWRDDWKYLLWYQQGDLHLFKGLVGSDIKPLFQYLFFAEFRLLGTHFFWYQFINVVLVSGAAFMIYLICGQFGLSPILSGAAAAVYLLHPTHFVNVLWIAQQCELVHILLLLISFHQGLLYLKTGKPMTLFWCSLCLLTQNYFFPNGTFFPLLLAALAFGSPHPHRQRTLWVVSALVLLVHIGFAWYIRGQILENVQQTGMLIDLPQKAVYVLHLTAVSVWRLLIPNYNPMSMPLWLTLASLPVFAIAYFFTLDRLPERWSWVRWAVGGTLLAAVTLGMTRYRQPEIHYYYTSLQLIFLLPAAVAMAGQLLSQRLRLARMAIVLLTAGFLLANLKGRMIFSERNQKNEMQMKMALRMGTDFEPFDDPALAWEDYVVLNGEKSHRTAVVLYEFLRDEE